MDQRASARTLLAVHKAALGSHAHADKAAAAVNAAARLLDGHHGSASGISAACMAPPAKGAGKGAKGAGKGSGKGSETWEQKTSRLQCEVSEAAVAGLDLTYLNTTLQRHLTSTKLWTSGGQPAAKAKVEPKPKAGSFAATNQANKNLHQSQKQLEEAAQLAIKARDEAAAASAQRAQFNADRNLKKKEERDAKRLADGPRPTQLCTECAYAGTYATSMKCHSCQEPFVAPRVPAPVAAKPLAGASAAAASSTENLFRASLKELQARPYAIVVTNGVPKATAPPPAPPAPAASGANLAAAVSPPAPGVASPSLSPPAPAPLVAPAVASPGAAPASAPVADADLEEARQLTALRAKKVEADIQMVAFKEVPAVLAALVKRAADLQLEISALMVKRQLALPPHQLGVLLGQRRMDLSTAQEKFAVLDKASHSQLCDHDTSALEIDTGFAQEIIRVTEAKKLAVDCFAAKRVALYESLAVGLTAAREACVYAQQQLTDAESTHATQSGATRAAAEAAAATASVQKVAAEAAAAAAAAAQTKAADDAAAAQQLLLEEHAATQQRLVDEAAATHQRLQLQLDEQQRLLTEQSNKLAAQQAVLQPSAVKPMAQLPPPPLPKDEETGKAWFRLRQFLALIAQQDAHVPVTWGELVSFHVDWDTFLTLVPLQIVQEVDQQLGAAAPEPQLAVPRRLVACLRDQMDSLAHSWLTDLARADSRAQLIEKANEYARDALDQAKRLQDRKRLAEEPLMELASTEQESANRPRRPTLQLAIAPAASA